MIRSLSEFKYFKSFRLPIESGDDVHCTIELDDPYSDRGEFIEDAELVDVSITGLGFKSERKIALGDLVTISLSYKRLRFDITGSVVRVISGYIDDRKMNYGIEIENEDREKMSRFISQLIGYFSMERLKDSIRNLALSERYSDLNEGFEMFSLMLSLFKDITQFANRKGFIDSMLEEVTRIMNAQRATVFLINTETNELEAYAATGVDKELLKFDYRKGVAGSVFTTGHSLNIDTTNENIKFFDKIDKKTGFKTKSVICSPVSNREDKVIGVLQILNKRNQDRFTEEDEKTMKVLSLIFSCFFNQYNPVSEKSLVRRFSAPSARQIVYIGKSESTTNLRKTILKVKDSAAPLCIIGERGVGKGLYAHILHAEGSRGLNEFESIQCRGASEEELKQRLFGDGETVGAISKCTGGTLCIQDVFCMPRELQYKLVKALEKNQTEGNEDKKGVRFIFTSSEDLLEKCDEGELIAELYNYVSAYVVKIDALRERKKDIEELIDYYMAKECKSQGYLQKVLSDEIRDALMDYEWPGNVAELKTAVARLVSYNPKNHVITEVDDEIMPILQSPLKAKISNSIPFVNDHSLDLKDRVTIVEREMILAEIKRNKGNKSKAAKEMGISREALRKKLLASDEVLSKIHGAEVHELHQISREQRKKAA